jgi:hypothetical protein
MRLTEYEKNARREIERWTKGAGTGPAGLFQKAYALALQPVDWVVDRVVPEAVVDQLSDALADVLAKLADASAWTFEADDVLESARARGIDAGSIEELRDKPLEQLDPLARSLFSQNQILAALSGGGTSLGGPLLMVADVPVLFGIGFRTIQQVGAAYGFELTDPAYAPLVVGVFNVAASGSREAKEAALREGGVAAAAFAHGSGYRGRRAQGTFREQMGHLPREIAKNLAARKLGQMIPIAGAAIGAGVNYWFIEQTATAASMLFRQLYLERKERL